MKPIADLITVINRTAVSCLQLLHHNYSLPHTIFTILLDIYKYIFYVSSLPDF